MTETMQPPAVTDFPVVWEHPDDEALWWARDRMHRPGQTSPFAHSWERSVFMPGFTAAAEAYSLPIGGWDARWVNTYGYSTIRPPAGMPEEIEAKGRRAEEALRLAIGRLSEAWETEHLPEILEHLAFWEAFDLEGATLPELTRHLEETLERGRRLWEVHFLIVHPAYIAVSEFEELYKELFGAAGAHEAFRLLAGLPNKTVESGQALWRLSRRARAFPEVLDALRTRAPGEVLPLLEGMEAGKSFLGEFRAYLEAYGERGELWGLESVSWIEDPTPVVRTLAEFVDRPDGDDPAAEIERLAVERERAVAEARIRLEGQPPEARGRFEAMLVAAQVGIVLTEDHGFYIDFCAHYRMRRVLLEVGRRLVRAGVLPDVDAVFMLTIDELLETAHGFPEVDRHALVAERRAEMERFAGVDAPLGIGTPPSEPPPDNPVTRALGKLFGRGPVQATDEVDVLAGHPGASGAVTGTARVVRDLEDADRLEPGDVLVAETTAPPWTPLFAVAAAVVTDTGGTLSHCAIVAREYGIPAVVGIGDATRRIADGQLVEVDGDRGVVRVVG